MNRQLIKSIPEHIVESQRVASDPRSSVWVTANAGSGKTYVLTARVLRLLLSEVKPAEILCLTYTKAAAAEMRGRIAERLGRWTLASESELGAELSALNGTRPEPKMLLRARSLFAHALETPGGLKIQTIHAFCESVLHRFPREAGVPFDFLVLEEHERDSLLVEAREEVIAVGLRGGANATAVDTLFWLLSDVQISTSISEALNQQRTLRKVLAQPAQAKAELRRRVRPAGSIAQVMTAVGDGYGLTAADHARLFELIAPNPNGNDFVDKLSRINPAEPDPEELFEAFLTKEGKARKTLIRKATAALIPDIAERLTAEAARIEEMRDTLTAAELVERSEAMLDIVGAISVHYEAGKRARSLLDFDDLIEKLAGLLENPAVGPWVQYKLDSGISHILVDESQDTNAEQWRVVDALVADFFTGDSAAQRPRTVFAVGDQKQSIFSFQGAEPELFIRRGSQYRASAMTAKLSFREVPLQTSFRTLPNVLDAVDQVFARAELREGVLARERPVRHGTARAEKGGLVTLWPPIQDTADETDPDDWPTQAPDAFNKSAPRRVAERIARQIRSWLDNGRALGPRGRRVRADDVLILVQVRSVLFHEVIRALVREGIPTPGADRLAVTTHIGVLDLMALGDVLLNTADDLQLAALLRSPLFEVSEEDLLAVAQPRPEKTTLWAALERSSSATVRAACEKIRGWRSRLDFERPFNFYADVLYAGGGLRKFRARLGAEVDDVAAQFLELALNHEQSEQPSLQGFLAEMRSRDITIKRELAEAGTGVRVMTVHGAKGLEAPIVILADAATTEKGRGGRTIYMPGQPPVFFHASSEKLHVAETLEDKREADEAQKNEYWRKLYVAMTRAEDELYVTGYLTKQGKVDCSWYEAIDGALRPSSEIVAGEDGADAAVVFPRERTPMPAAAAATIAVAGDAAVELPDLQAYRLRRIVRPSSAGAAADLDRVLDRTIERLGDIRDPEAARREGIALHALLHHLSRIAPADREAVAARALPALLPEAPGGHQRLSETARRILLRPDLSAVFGSDSRPEVPILAQGRQNGQPITIAGRIDRLVVTPGQVLIVDFKSDAVAPSSADEVPPAYLRQLGLYALCARQMFPGHDVRAAILWTTLESLINLPSVGLRQTVAGFTIG